MAKRHLSWLSATVFLALLASSVAHPALARLPWAATTGLNYVEAIVNADNYRAAASALAMKKSPSPEVRELGRMLWQASIENSRTLRLVVNSTEPYVFLPTHVSTKYMFVIDELVGVSGDAFDRRFIAQQATSLREVLALAESYSQVGDDFALKDFAAQSIPKLKMQLARALDIEVQHGLMAAH